MSLALLIGDCHSGKTSTCRRLVESARAHGLTVGGILAPALHEGGRCIGYEVVDVATGQAARLATTAGSGVEQTGRFRFLAEGLALGRAALERTIEPAPELVIVDEVGQLELDGGGWSRQVDQLVGERPGLTLLVVRRELATRVAQRWSLPSDSCYDLVQGSDAVIAGVIERVETG
ncbi:MAG TPA: nucleoside-triphosphatase [Phycisphaerae bacterium]|nr:nucleoside-triphosphatase [Phycisphaerae bacterium]